MISTDAMAGLAAYIASKQGITGFSQSLAAEVGESGVSVIAFAPGMVDTPGIRAVAAGLAPRLGMTPQQFLGLSLHPAYDGYMPAEHAGAATAYLAAVLAKEYHGETVTGYTVLERAGVIRPAAQAAAAAAGSPVAAPTATLDQAIETSLAACRELQSILTDTEAQVNKLPIFVRPMARNGFKSTAGQSLQEWQRTLATLAGQLQDLATGRMTVAAWGAGRAQILDQLTKLRLYYAGEPAEAARFSKDPAFLAEANRVMQRRVGVVDTLVAALAQIANE